MHARHPGDGDMMAATLLTLGLSIVAVGI